MPKIAEMSAAPASVDQHVADVGYWWHSIELPGGVITPGQVGLQVLQDELANLHPPDLEGKTVLDIGAWDGFFSFAAEEAGASRVVALDHFVWSLDHARAHEYGDYVAGARAAGERPLLWGPSCPWWDPEGLPGKRGFDTARACRGSRVESVVADFMTCDLNSLGSFDVTLFLGVLYHLTDPLAALRRLRTVTTEVAIVETAAMKIDGHDEALLEFTAGGEPKKDVTNWFLPNEQAAVALLLAAGFEEVTPVARLFHEQRSQGVTDFRLVLHARPVSDRPIGIDEWAWAAQDHPLAGYPERVAELERDLAELERDLAALRNTRTFRYTALPRRLYGRLRQIRLSRPSDSPTTSGPR